MTITAQKIANKTLHLFQDRVNADLETSRIDTMVREEQHRQMLRMIDGGYSIDQ